MSSTTRESKEPNGSENKVSRNTYTKRVGPIVDEM